MNEGGLWKWSLSLCLWELYEGNLEGGLLYWEPRRICLVRLWKWECVHRGPVLGNVGEGSFTRTFERRVKFIFCIRGTFIEEFERHVKEALEMGVSLHWGTWWGFVYRDF